MLDEGEFAEVAPLLSKSVQNVKDYRAENGASLQEALNQGFDIPAREKYEEMTGYRIADINEIRNHRLSKYGSECLKCGSLLRTDWPGKSGHLEKTIIVERRNENERERNQYIRMSLGLTRSGLFWTRG